MQEIITAVVIDNDMTDIIGISGALATAGISSLPIHFQDASLARQHCKSSAGASPRIIITDIQMKDGGDEPSQTDLANVTGCLAEIVKNTEGPYVILAWTSKPTALPPLKEVVEKYFHKNSIREPLYFDGISKKKCQNEDGYDAEIILQKFNDHLETQSELRVLMNWERQVLSAANKTVNALVEIPETKLSETLSALGDAVAGKNLTGNEAIAINEAISNILRDEIGQHTLVSAPPDLWSNAVKSPESKLPEKGRHALNSLLHIDHTPNLEVICPGDVWICDNWLAVFERLAFPSETMDQVRRFIESMIVCDQQVVDKKKRKRDHAQNDIIRNEAQAELDDIYRRHAATNSNLKLALMEVSPACDFSNNKKPLKSLALGLIVSTDDLKKPIGLANTNDVSQCKIKIGGENQVFAISAKYLVSLSASVLSNQRSKMKPKKIFRMRESLLHSWVQNITSYNARIGTIVFK